MQTREYGAEEQRRQWWEWWHCGGGGGGWLRRTRISNWSETVVELRLLDSRNETPVCNYSISPNGRKKLRCAKVRELCGGDDSNVLLHVCNPSSGELLTEPITAQDLDNNAEIKIRTRLDGDRPFFLLKIPRNPPSRGSRHGGGIQHQQSYGIPSISHRSVSSHHTVTVPLTVNSSSSPSSSTAGSFRHVHHHVIHPHPYIQGHSLLHITNNLPSRSSPNLATPSFDATRTPIFAHSSSLPTPPSTCLDCSIVGAAVPSFHEMPVEATPPAPSDSPDAVANGSNIPPPCDADGISEPIAATSLSAT